VRFLVRTEVGMVATIAVALLVTYIGFAIFMADKHRVGGFLVLVAGIWAFFASPVLHDQLHRERGENSHAVWGRNERRKPPWWPTHH
jgi:hypothetical protein